MGDEVEGSTGHWLKVAAISKVGRKLIAYNLEVKDFHTYFVGDSEAWVHNSCEPEISAVAPDWGVKGAHIKVDGIELSVRPGKDGDV